MIIIALIIALFVGSGFAFAVTAYCVKTSNDIGDSKATFEDFSKSELKVIEKRDRMKENEII